MLGWTVGCITSRYYQQPGSALHKTLRDTGPTEFCLHSKVAFHVCDSENSACHWVYMGSHNLTKDSWWNNNYEGGVIVMGADVTPFINAMPYQWKALKPCREPFRFYPSKEAIRAAGHKLQDREGKEWDPAEHYHWYRFLEEFENNFGRH
jgi:phosphatidylserine/phosphatidylglycerophosphate/cardiolipin synthase-like enzyme